MSSLTAIEKFNHAAKPTQLHALPDDEAQALARVFGKARKGPATEAERTQASQVLQKLISLGAWLACSCVNGDDGPPVMYPRRGRTGTATLVRNHDRPVHAENCPFFRLPADRTEPPSLLPRASMTGGFGVLKVVKVTGEPKDKPSKPTVITLRTCKRVPTLARILFTVLERAELNVIAPSGPEGINAQYAALKRALAQFHFDAGKTISLADFTETFTQLKDYKRLIVRIAKDSRQWPDPLLPHGFLIGVCHDIDEHSLVLRNGGKLPIAGQLVKPGENTPGPYMCIVLVGRSGPGKSFEALRAYVHPVASAANLVLVDSDLERQTLGFLQSHQSQEIGEPFTIVKPLTDIAVKPGAQSVRPDFILKYASYDLVVETMGYTDEAYLSRKTVTHALMSEIGAVMKHDGIGDDDEAFKQAWKQLRAQKTR
ncbi:hypothetical protein [Paraburkholderia sp. Ac-20347]|uniref:hypothetical protein n=1 Tax=Paraburkholderia sp. Ac-20347 TaxID=2703892 RepID=UPI00198111A3|nr:hypothetical protein [Paraburkholderia sp. Ac-20347]MBN3811316.1 hypothetical protein [Paraburkholderia sp. Ac-20347]